MQQLGRYLLEAELGRGAMGVVYRARDPRIDRVVALKTLRPDAVPDPAAAAEVKQRFLNEAKAAGRLNHPGIVTVFDADEDPATGVAYLAMEFVEGVELKDRLRSVSPEQLADIVDDIAAALDHAHSRGIVHRDVKPANILLDSEGRARLTDFGIARLGESTMTQDGQFLGSPAYMSPEQVRSQEITGASDIFGLGVVIFEALTGSRPFLGADLVSTTHAIANEEPRRPTEIATDLPPAVDGVLKRALAKNPAERPATATELAQLLRAALCDESSATVTMLGDSPVKGPAAPGSPLLASRKLQLGLAAVLLALIAVTAFALRGGGDEPAAVSEAPRQLVSAEPDPEAVPAADPESDPESDPAPAPEPDPEVEPEAASEPEPESEPEPDGDPAAAGPTGTLRIDLFTFHSGTLTVFDGDREIGRRSVSELKRRKKLRLKNPKRHFVVEVEAPVGRRTLAYVFQVRDGKRLRARSVKDIAEDGVLKVTLDVGTLGRDLDVRYP